METHASERSTGASTDSHTVMSWKHVLEALPSRPFSLNTRHIICEDALKHYALDAIIHIERLDETTFQAKVEPLSLTSTPGWECPATMRYIVQTIGSRLAAACGYQQYRMSSPSEELQQAHSQVMYFEMLPEKEQDPRDNAIAEAGYQWTKVLPVTPEQPDMTRDLLRPGFCW